MLSRGLTLAAFALAAACSSSSPAPDPLGPVQNDPACKFESDKQNCYARAVADAESCLGGAKTVETLSADRTSCTASDGSGSVTFTSALATDGSALPGFDATLSKDGKTCIHFVHSADGGFSLTGPTGGTTSMSYVGTHEVAVTCPDGTSFRSNDQDLCLLVLPGSLFTQSSGSEIAATVEGMNEPIFDCRSK